MNTVNIVTVVDSNRRSLLICFTGTHFIKTKYFYFIRKCQQHYFIRQLFQHAHVYTKHKINSSGPYWNDIQNKIFTKLILYQIRKYQGIMVLLISLNIDCSEGTDLRLIFKNRCVRFMTDFKMVTSKRVPS